MGRLAYSKRIHIASPLVRCETADNVLAVTTPSPAPGWYPDPSGAPQQRYFDGTSWTENYAPSGVPAPSVGQTATKPGMSRGKKIGIGVGAAILALIALGSIGNNGNKPAPPPSNSATATKTADPVPMTTEPTIDKPNFTPGQDNAIAKAKNYLGFAAFSKDGLIKQLEYDQFSTPDATFAVEQIEAEGGVDWNAQAVKKAENYLGFSSFSLSGLVDQLKYDGFTPEQAEYGANTAYEG